MSNVICYEVFSTQKNVNEIRKKLVKKHNFVERPGQYGNVIFYIEVPSIDAWEIQYILDKYNFKYRKSRRLFGEIFSLCTEYRLSTF